MLDEKTICEGSLGTTEIKSIYGDLKDKFEESIELEKRKYPLSEREKLFTDTIIELLSILDRTHTRFY